MGNEIIKTIGYEVELDIANDSEVGSLLVTLHAVASLNNLSAVNRVSFGNQSFRISEKFRRFPKPQYNMGLESHMEFTMVAAGPSV